MIMMRWWWWLVNGCGIRRIYRGEIRRFIEAVRGSNAVDHHQRAQLGCHVTAHFFSHIYIYIHTHMYICIYLCDFNSLTLGYILIFLGSHKAFTSVLISCLIFFFFFPLFVNVLYIYVQFMCAHSSSQVEYVYMCICICRCRYSLTIYTYIYIQTDIFMCDSKRPRPLHLISV